MNIEYALKSQISKEHSKYLCEKEYSGIIFTALFKAWAKYNDVDAVWDFIESGERSISVKWNSKLLGIKTEIKDYTTKTGRVFKAHYTINGKYLRCVRKDDDDEDRYYTGYFKICRQYFDIDFTLNTEHTLFSHFLKPKKQHDDVYDAETEDENEEVIFVKVVVEEPTYDTEQEDSIKDIARDVLENGGSLNDVKDIMETAEIPFYRKLVKSIVMNL